MSNGSLTLERVPVIQTCKRFWVGYSCRVLTAIMKYRIHTSHALFMLDKLHFNRFIKYMSIKFKLEKPIFFKV